MTLVLHQKPEYNPCYCIGPQKGETLCPCMLHDANRKKRQEANK